MDLTSYEQHLFSEARQGRFNEFTSYWFNLEYSGTWYTPEDRVEVYQALYDVWQQVGKPDDVFDADVAGRAAEFTVIWGNYGTEPAFLYRHGYLFLPWASEMLHCGVPVAVVEGGTGSAKTSTVGIFHLVNCAIHPGFDGLNAGPTSRQSQDMLEEAEKWVTGTRFEKLIVPTRDGSLWRWRPHPIMRIDAGLGGYSTFMCQTLAGDPGNISGNSILGTGKDLVTVDECGLVYDIDEAMARLITRYRGTRRTGMPRHCAPAFIAMTNPHPNPSFDALRMRAMSEPDLFAYFQPHQDENVYITAQQARLHKAVLSERQQERWLEGNPDAYSEMGAIPIRLITENNDDTLTQLLEDPEAWEREPVYGDQLGLRSYEFKREEGRTYLVWGDPGTGNMITIMTNNVPVVGALDVTGFPEAPARMVCCHVLDGHGKYSVWVHEMQRLMLFYQAVGAYDATGVGRALQEWPDFARFPLFPVTLSGNNKATARTMFVLFAGRGLFRWPRMNMLEHQARVYRESGTGKHKLPDDILSGLFVASFYLRATFYRELAALFEWDFPDLDPAAPPDIAIGQRSRYTRRGNRYVRRRIGPTRAR